MLVRQVEHLQHLCNSCKISLLGMRNYLYETQAFKLAYAVRSLGHLTEHD